MELKSVEGRSCYGSSPPTALLNTAGTALTTVPPRSRQQERAPEGGGILPTSKKEAGVKELPRSAQPVVPAGCSIRGWWGSRPRRTPHCWRWETP